MTFQWSIAFEMTLLAIGAAAAWLFFSRGWNRLHRAPRRPHAITPLSGGALLIAMIIAGVAGAAMAAQFFGLELMPPDDAEVSLPDLAKLTLGTYTVQGIVAAGYLYLLLNARRPLNDNRVKPAQAVLIGAGALLLFWPMVHVVGWVATRIAMLIVGPVETIAHDTLAMLVTSDRDAWLLLMIGLVIIAAPVLEEVLYRGIIQETLGQLGMGSWTAILMTSAIFTLMHAAVVPPWALVTLFALSLGFGWVYEKTGRLTAPIVMHMLFNGGNVLLAMLVA